MKPKLFLKTKDVTDMTDQCERTALKILTHIRRQEQLGKLAPVSIFAFSKVFSIPPDVLFCYINMDAFKILPITRDELSNLSVNDLKTLSQQFKLIDSKAFVGFGNVLKKSEVSSEK